MIYPIVAFGDPVLKKVAADIPTDFEGLDVLIKDMYSTMDKANGVGLAAPQIGKSIRLFVIDSTLMVDEDDDEVGIRKAFINAEILDEYGEEMAFEEGCLSIPEIREDVVRPSKVLMRYQNEQFETFEEEFDGMTARVIQHEYDHIEGILFTDYLKPLKKRMLKSRLQSITKGKVRTHYKMKFQK